MFTVRTNPSSIVFGAIALAAALFVFVPAAGGEEFPAAEKVLDRYVEAIGGVKTFDKLASSVTKASLAIPAMGLTIDITAYAERPNKFYSLAESEMIGKIERGTDGTVFWEKSTMQGPRILEGEELAEAMLEAKFEGLAYWRSIYDSAAVSGFDTVDGSPAYKVVMKPKAGKARTFAFDVKSGLLVKTMTTVTTPMGDISVVAQPYIELTDDRGGEEGNPDRNRPRLHSGELELLFDAGFGELFVVRLAGNVISPEVAGTIQYAGTHLRTPLFVVLGHEGCGAVTAALAAKFRGARERSRIEVLLQSILPALDGIDPDAPPDAQLHAAVEANVRWTTRQILETPEAQARQAEGVMKLVGAIADLATGRVRFLDEPGVAVDRPGGVG